MQVVELSNHPSDMLHDVSLRRQAADPQRAGLTDRQGTEIARLIRRDHDFHVRTRRPRTRHR